jgi:hypothetical protein
VLDGALRSEARGDEAGAQAQGKHATLSRGRVMPVRVVRREEGLSQTKGDEEKSPKTRR